jgi:hypothetical protein
MKILFEIFATRVLSLSYFVIVVAVFFATAMSQVGAINLDSSFVWGESGFGFVSGAYKVHCNSKFGCCRVCCGINYQRRVLGRVLVEISKFPDGVLAFAWSGFFLWNI